MADLSERALEDLIVEIAGLALQRGIVLHTKPRRLFVPRYPNETSEDYDKKVQNALQLIRELQKREDEAMRP